MASPQVQRNIGVNSRIYSETAAGVVRAAVLRIKVGLASIGLRRPETVRLPPVKGERPSDGDLERLATLCRRTTSVLLFWRIGTCFFRSYAWALVLRARGVPLVVNFGQAAAANRRRPFAHCWLTLDGSPFHEDKNTLERYNTLIGGIPNETAFWLGTSVTKHLTKTTGRQHGLSPD